jgi:hypothetical protein
MRCEEVINNESDALVLASAALHGSGSAPGDAGWDAAIAARQVLAVWLESEDPVTVRVLVDEQLDDDEQSQWVGVVRGTLDLPDGRLALCGGVAWLLDGNRWTAPFARIVELGAGCYRVTLYCYAAAPNGRWCVEQSGSGEQLGAWFRRTHADRLMPVWLHNRCVDDPSLDPGHSAQWRSAAELPGGDVVDFVLHLELFSPGTRAEDAHAPVDGLWLPRECRKPEPFPLGLAPAGKALALVNPVAAKADTKLSKWHLRALARHLASRPPQPIDGRPVRLPIADLVRLVRIAWLCYPYTHPGLRISRERVPQWPDIEDVEISVDELGSCVSFRFHEQPADALKPLSAFSAQLGQRIDGSILEVICARPGHGGPLGAQHWRGVVHAGQWEIEAASPPVDAATLTEALALVAALEGGRRLRARDELEAQSIAERVQRNLADYFGSNALLRDGAELSLRRRDNALFEHIVARVFWMRYAAVWPLQDLDAAH